MRKAWGQTGKTDRHREGEVFCCLTRSSREGADLHIPPGEGSWKPPVSGERLEDLHRFFQTHIDNDGDLGQNLKEEEPNTDVLGTLSHRSAVLADKFLGVQTDFDPVIEQGEERGQWESSHKNGDEAKLEH